jgi:hypothetical protein
MMVRLFEGHVCPNVAGGRKSIKYPKGCDIDPKEFPADWFAGLRDEQVCRLNLPR